jgi:hypothetical protein
VFERFGVDRSAFDGIGPMPLEKLQLEGDAGQARDAESLMTS